MTELTIQSTARQRRLLEWSQKIAECRSSGLSVSRWCSDHGINLKTYYRWQKKVFAEMVKRQEFCQQETEDSKPRFAELPATQEELKSREPVATVRMGQASLEVYEGASPEIISVLCRVLKHAQ